MPHFPVLLRETMNLLALSLGDKVIDCTFGDGGHGQEILKQIGSNGRLLGIDADPENIRRAKQIFAKAKNLILVNDNFVHLEKIAEKYNFKPIQAILIDLGWSRTQFEESGRGFSFLKDEPLDMRYNKLRTLNSEFPSLTAQEIVNQWEETALGRILREYGEERNWREIARAIVRSRKEKPIKTTSDLVQIIRSSKFIIHNSRLHPATKIFQALRIAVNDELNNLRQALPSAVEILAPAGRLAVINFHSLEDRIVKRFFKTNKSLKIITKKPICPTFEEIKINPSSRSAKLRVAKKI